MARSARDVMQTALLTLSPEESLIDAHRFLVENDISGAPVVSDQGQVIGVVSATDLMRGVREEEDSAVSDPRYFRDLMEFSGPDWGSVPEDFQDRMAQRTVEEVMSREVIAVAPDDPIAEVARTLRFHKVHRVLVQDDGQLVGIVTAFDLVGLLEKDEGR